MAPTQTPNVGIFVDVQNIYYTTRDAHGRQFDYRALWRRLSVDHHIEVANAYATDRGDAKQQGFQKALHHIGFEVKLKPYIQRADGSAKGDWDVGITIDILTHAPELDKIVLLSGDGDFDLLAHQVIKAHAIPFEVFGVPTLTADSLINSATEFHTIDETLLI